MHKRKAHWEKITLEATSAQEKSHQCTRVGSKTQQKITVKNTKWMKLGATAEQESIAVASGKVGTR